MPPRHVSNSTNHTPEPSSTHRSSPTCPLPSSRERRSSHTTNGAHVGKVIALDFALVMYEPPTSISPFKSLGARASGFTSATASNAVPTVVPVPAARRNRCDGESAVVIITLFFGADDSFDGDWKRSVMSRMVETSVPMVAPVVAPRVRT